MSEIINRIIRIIRIKQWARNKRKAITETKEKAIIETKESSKDSEPSENHFGVVGTFIGGIIAVIIAIQVTSPVISSMTTTMQPQLNSTSGNSTEAMSIISPMLNLLPLMFVITLSISILRPLV